MTTKWQSNTKGLRRACDNYEAAVEGYNAANTAGALNTPAGRDRLNKAADKLRRTYMELGNVAKNWR